MKVKALIFICLLAILLLLGSGCIDSSNEPVKETKLKEVTVNQNSSFNSAREDVSVDDSSEKSKTAFEPKKQSSFSKYYSKEDLQFKAKVSSYPLPLQASEIANYNQFAQKIPLNEDTSLLYKNGFVVIENGTTENLFTVEQTLVNDSYRDLKVADIPIFITSDSLLHLYHIQFDETLKRIEEEEFYGDLWELDKALLKASIEDYKSASGEEKEAARRNAAYFTVALSLLSQKKSR